MINEFVQSLNLDTRKHTEVDFEENSWNTNNAKKGRDSHAVSKETSSFRSARTTLHGSSVCGTGSLLYSLDTNRTTERTKLARESGHERDRASLLSERKGGQLAVTRRTCLTNYPAQLQRRYTLLGNRIHKRCSSNVAPPRIVELPEDSHFVFFSFLLFCFNLFLSLASWI